MSWLAFVLLSLASYRATRLIVTDELTLPLRQAIARRFPGEPDEAGGWKASLPVAFVSCAWCVGMWAALAGALVLHLGGLAPSWTWVVLAWLAASSVAGFLARLEG